MNRPNGWLVACILSAIACSEPAQPTPAVQGRCGDGTVNSGEECDAGAANSDAPGALCRTGCKFSSCGDGIVDPDEACDGGSANSDTAAGACRTSCVLARCGDGAVDPGEACDRGTANSDIAPNACRKGCVLPRCGDRVTDSGEECDAGPANSDSDRGACRTSCLRASCGDGVADHDEGCDLGASNSDTVPGGCRTDCTPAPPALRRPSKSGTIAVTGNDRFVVMVNPEADSIAIFSTADGTRQVVPTGDEPSAVVIHPDDRTVYVAHRAARTVVRVSTIDTNPVVTGVSVPVGSEPVGLALSPSGRRLFVAELGEGRITVINTEAMQPIAWIETPERPRAILVTNNGDTADNDETLIVPEFYGEANANGEAKDTGRTGRISLYTLHPLSELLPAGTITLAPIASGFVPTGASAPSMTSPNQLSSVAMYGGKLYVTSVSASPEPPLVFDGNVYPVVYVADLASRQEDRSNVGSANLARKVFDATSSAPRFALADLVDIAFTGSGATPVAYALSRGADVVQRLVYDSVNGLTVGSPQNLQIDLLATPTEGGESCRTPTGLVSAHASASGKLYVNCWANRRLGVVDIATQSLEKTLEAAPMPVDGDELNAAQGRRFFFTARGRWSASGWSSCGSCHPDGLADGITWSFAAGPRQTTSLDGSFSHGASGQKQRVFNWTGIFDEMHDFERNTRDVSGGVGAVTTAAAGSACGSPANEEPVPLGSGLDQPVKETIETTPGVCNTSDWDDIETFVRALRPPRARRTLDQASVDRGAALFGEGQGGCVRCHGGTGWTASRLFWTPSQINNQSLKDADFVPPPNWPVGWSAHTKQIEVEKPGDAAPHQVACVSRNIGTYGVPGDATATGALEVRANGTSAQGSGGYNVPSLYGLAVSGPYLHHGQARTLEDLFTDPKWQSHTTAGNLLFAPNAAQVRDLVSFLLSIDADTQEQPLPAGWDGCP